MNNNYTKGYVTLPIEEYNKLLRSANALRESIKLSTNYSGEKLNVEIDKPYLVGVATDLFWKSEFTNDYVPLDYSDIYLYDFTLAEKPPLVNQVDDDDEEDLFTDLSQYADVSQADIDNALIEMTDHSDQ